VKPVVFDYVRPDTVDEALMVLAEHGSDAVLLAGGMSLGPMLNMRLVRPAVVVDLNRVDGLGEIGVEGNELAIGATVRQADAMRHVDIRERVPLLSAALRFVGHYQTRNRGTLGGSVAHADPSAEIPLALVTLGGQIELRSRKAQRMVDACNFFHGVLTTDRRFDEMIVGLRWPMMPELTGYAFEEVSPRPGDFAIAAVACAATVDSTGRIEALRLGLGGIEDRPILVDASDAIGHAADDGVAGVVAEQAAASADPIEDMSADADYRKALVRTLAATAIVKAVAEAATKANGHG
jgi:CO/xanthine dehydrogenase FAD-binding subunit